MPGREALGQLVHLAPDLVRGFERVGAGTLEHRDGDGGLAVEIGVRGVALSAQFDAADVADPHERRRRRRYATTTSPKALGIDQAAGRLDGQFERAPAGLGLCAKRASGDLDVLAAQAASTSPAVRPRAAIVSGSSQIRIE